MRPLPREKGPPATEARRAGLQSPSKGRERGTNKSVKQRKNTDAPDDLDQQPQAPKRLVAGANASVDPSRRGPESAGYRSVKAEAMRASKGRASVLLPALTPRPRRRTHTTLARGPDHDGYRWIAAAGPSPLRRRFEPCIRRDFTRPRTSTRPEPDKKGGSLCST